MFKVTRGYVLAATLTEEKKNEEMKYPVYSSQTKDNGLMGYYKDYLYEDAITWTTDGANAGTVNFRAGKFYCTNVCGVLLSDKIQANKMISEALNNVAKGYVSYVGNPKLMNNVMADISIMLPKHSEEREQLSKLFTNLDHLITLHQRKDVFLCKQKVFIDLTNCPHSWEQRKLGDEAIEMLAGGDIDKSRVVENGKYPIYANALTNDGIVGYYDDYYRVKAPAVTVTGRGDVGHAQARTVDFTPVVRLLAIRSEHDAYFLENAINNHGVIVESTGVPQLTVPQLGNYMIQFPRTIEEETKIGDYFRNLDNLITLHQREKTFNIMEE